MARRFYRDNKRVSNRRIKEEWGGALAYPDDQAGLAAILAAEGVRRGRTAHAPPKPSLALPVACCRTACFQSRSLPRLSYIPLS